MNDNRGTLITIAVVLIVSIVVLFAVLAFTWRMISEPINDFSNWVTSLNKYNNTDYNFPVPVINTDLNLDGDNNPDTNEIELVVNMTEQERDYNFEVPILSSSQGKVERQLLNDANSVPDISANSQPSNFIIQIPKLALNSTAFTARSEANPLTRGMWIYPKTTSAPVGEKILVCSQSFFKISDPKSCFDLNRLKVDDRIFKIEGDFSTEYAVSSVETISFDDKVYGDLRKEDSLRIVSCDPASDCVKRIVVKAGRI